MKISVVMQSYLGTYPGSRSRPEYKFVRAVSSFLSQDYRDKELVIVSDGCDTTRVLYEMLYSTDERIKFCYLPRSTKKMYEGEDGAKFYRGVPRKIGCALAEGDVITYMDSDDIMLPNRLPDLAVDWSKQPDSVKWASNSVRYLHQAALDSPKFRERRVPLEGASVLNLRTFGHDIPDLFWVNQIVAEGFVSGATYSLSHRKNVHATWKDTTATFHPDGRPLSGASEDITFLRDLQDMDGSGFRQESPSYVVCHYREIWDV